MEAVRHAAFAQGAKAEIKLINSEEVSAETETLQELKIRKLRNLYYGILGAPFCA